MGVYLPGRFNISQGYQADFVSPVYVGDKLTVSGKVVEINESVGQIVLTAEIRNQEGKKVVRGKIWTGLSKVEGGA